METMKINRIVRTKGHEVSNLIVKNAVYAFNGINGHNWKGARTDFNAEGQRYIKIEINCDKSEFYYNDILWTDTEELVKNLSNDGFTVKVRETEGGNQYFIKINVSYSYWEQPGDKPLVHVYRSDNPEDFEDYYEKEVGDIDDMDISTMNLELRPRFWEMPGTKKSGFSLYLDMAQVLMTPSFLNRSANPFE